MVTTPLRMLNYKRLLLVISFLIGLGLVTQSDPVVAQNSPANPLQEIPDAIIEPGNGPDRYILVVEKATQTLFIYQYKNNQYYLEKYFACTTGENVGDKMVEGDKKTPEGFYLFKKKALESELAPIYGVLAFPMDYPNFWDKHLGKGGSGIWMHGNNRPRVPRDSNGCIALDNIDLIEIEPLVRLHDTPIIVYSKVQYEAVEEAMIMADRIKAFLEDWRQSWENKKFERYKAMYAPDFKSDDGKDYNAWMAHKSRINSLYKDITVRLSDFRIFRHKGVIVALFTQHYRGNNKFDSKGTKRLYLEETNGRFQIKAEVWYPTPPRAPEKMLSTEVVERVRSIGRLVASAQPVNETPRTEAAAAASTTQQPSTPSTPTKPVMQTASVERIANGAAQVIKNNQKARDTKQVIGIVADWLKAWRDQDIERYIGYYHPDFQFKGMDLSGYREYKEKLKKKYRRITIDVDKVDVMVSGSKALVTFIQDYRSDQYRDRGIKTLEFRKKNEDWRIRKETWKDISAGAKP